MHESKIWRLENEGKQKDRCDIEIISIKNKNY